MNNSLRPGTIGEPLPNNTIVLRLYRPSKDFWETMAIDPLAFDLSTEDKESELQSLTVWVEALTAAEKARELMGQNNRSYRVALYLHTDKIRTISFDEDESRSPLDVVWEPDPRPGAEGHAGITGLKRPPMASRSAYKALRAKLTKAVFSTRMLPELPRTSG